MEKLGDVDSIQQPTSHPQMAAMLWLAPVKLPGCDLADDSLWQMDEQVRIQPEDYDRILDEGWVPWFGRYAERYLGEALAGAQMIQEAGPRWTREQQKRGYVVFAPLVVEHGGRGRSGWGARRLCGALGGQDGLSRWGCLQRCRRSHSLFLV